jgi:branched-subunit amino acid ABC-type transport system permease component
VLVTLFSTDVIPATVVAPCRPSATALMCFLAHAGYRMAAVYGRQFQKVSALACWGTSCCMQQVVQLAGQQRYDAQPLAVSSCCQTLVLSPSVYSCSVQ